MGQIDRAAKWNLKRGMTYDADLFMRLVSEEIKEFYDATAEDDLVEMVDAMADVKFVGAGMSYLFNLQTYNTVEEYKLAQTKRDDIDAYITGHWDIITEYLQARSITVPMAKHIYSIVCDANDLKHDTKNEFGKITKGPNWVDPAGKIREYLIKEGVLKEE